MSETKGGFSDTTDCLLWALSVMRPHRLAPVLQGGSHPAGLLLTASVSLPGMFLSLPNGGGGGHCIGMLWPLSSEQTPNSSIGMDGKKRHQNKKFHVEMEMAGVCTRHCSNQCRLPVCCPPSAHMSAHLTVASLTTPPAPSLGAFSAGSCARSTAHNCFCTYVMQMRLYSNWHDN